MEKAKSLNLQRAVSKNPEKILFKKSGRKQCEMGEDIGAFLEELTRNRASRVKLSDQTIMDWVTELGARRNRRLGVK